MIEAAKVKKGTARERTVQYGIRLEARRTERQQNRSRRVPLSPEHSS
jgi:hypothetical protein